MLIGNQIKEITQLEQKDPKTQYQTNGYIKKDFDKYHEQDVAKCNATFDLFPVKEFGTQFEAIEVVNPYGTDGVVDIINIQDNCKTIGDMMQSLQLKFMDIIVSIDSAATKKEGRTVIIMPKIKL